MSRSGIFIKGFFASYLNIAANIIYTLVSIPIAIHFLNKELFGLWSLATQVQFYVMLLELGIGLAVNRCIADHKDDTNNPEFASHVSAAGIVYIIQGIVIATIGIGLSCIAPSLISIPAAYVEEFRYLLIFLSINSGFSLSFRLFGSPLWAFHRIDVINYCFSSGLILSLITLCICLYNGVGVIAYPASQIPAIILAPIVYFIVCYRNKYYPPLKSLVLPRWRTFTDVFRLGRDTLFIQIGRQSTEALQLLVIGKFIGLGAAAIYSVCTKTYALSRLCLAAPISASETVLTEMFVRSEEQGLKQRSHLVQMATLSMATVIATGIATMNRDFVMLWTHGKITWSWHEDLAIALNMIARSTILTLMNMFGIAKEYRQVRYIYALECLIFLILCIPAVQIENILPIILASTATQFLIILPLVSHTYHKSFPFHARTNHPIIISSLTVFLSSCASHLMDVYGFTTFIKIPICILLVIVSALIACSLFITKSDQQEIIARIKSYITPMIRNS